MFLLVELAPLCLVHCESSFPGPCEASGSLSKDLDSVSGRKDASFLLATSHPSITVSRGSADTPPYLPSESRRPSAQTTGFGRPYGRPGARWVTSASASAKAAVCEAERPKGVGRTRLFLSVENRFVDAKRGFSDSPHGLLLTRSDRHDRQRDDATPADVSSSPTRPAASRQACCRPALTIAAPSSVTESRCSRRTTRTRTGSPGPYSSPVSINVSLRPCTGKSYAGQDVAHVS